MSFIFTLIWIAILLITVAYILRVLELAFYVKRKMNGSLNVPKFIGDVIVSTLSPVGVGSMLTGTIARKIKQNGRLK